MYTYFHHSRRENNGFKSLRTRLHSFLKSRKSDLQLEKETLAPAMYRMYSHSMHMIIWKVFFLFLALFVEASTTTQLPMSLFSVLSSINQPFILPIHGGKLHTRYLGNNTTHKRRKGRGQHKMRKVKTQHQLNFSSGTPPPASSNILDRETKKSRTVELQPDLQDTHLLAGTLPSAITWSPAKQ